MAAFLAQGPRGRFGIAAPGERLRLGLVGDQGMNAPQEPRG